MICERLLWVANKGLTEMDFSFGQWRRWRFGRDAACCVEFTGHGSTEYADCQLL